MAVSALEVPASDLVVLTDLTNLADERAHMTIYREGEDEALVLTPYEAFMLAKTLEEACSALVDGLGH